MTPELKPKRLILQARALEDAPQVQKLFPHWEIVKYLNKKVPWPYPPDGAISFIRDVSLPAAARGESWDWSLRLKSEPEQLIGCINLTKGEDVNRGFWLVLLWHGRGLKTEACDEWK